MSIINFSDLNLSVNKDTNSFDFNGQTIEISKYLPISDKYDLVMITLQKAYEDGYYNDVKLDVYFHLHLVYLYTNLLFTQEEKEDEIEVYDKLLSSGFLAAFLANFPENEYNELFNTIKTMAEVISKNNMSAGATIAHIIKTLPDNAEKAANIMKQLDPEKFKQLMDAIQGVQGGKPITMTKN